MQARKRTRWRAVVGASLLLASAAGSGVALGEQKPARTLAPRQVSVASRPPRTNGGARAVAFQSERTDDWLCRHVSAFFCTQLFQAAPEARTNTTSQTTRQRGRN